MGALFSSSEPHDNSTTRTQAVHNRERYYSSPSYNQNYAASAYQRQTDNSERSNGYPSNVRQTNQFPSNAGQNLAARQRRRPKSYYIRDQPEFLFSYLDEPFHTWSSNKIPKNKSFEMTLLAMWEQEAQKVARLFKTTNNLYRILEIHRLENPYLWACYTLKKAELEYEYGRNVKERHLFHGTKARNIDSIAENNFDWRLCGTAIGNRFGQGVSFSPLSKYSSHSCDNNRNGQSCSSLEMLLVRVLQIKCCEGDSNMMLPIGDCDTSVKPGGHVVVKFEDNTFYPAYKIVFCKRNMII